MTSEMISVLNSQCMISDPEEIDLLVSTHFDFDHCGNHDLFSAGITSLVHSDAIRQRPP